MKRTKCVALALLIALYAILIIGGVYQSVVVTDGEENNAISHSVELLSLDYWWFPLALALPIVVFAVGGTLCLWHWFYTGHFGLWPRAKWVDEDEDK